MRGRVRVEQQDGPVRGPRPGAVFQQQGGLADASRAVHQQDPPGRTAQQDVVETGQLASAAHEGPAPRVVQQVAETRRHRNPLPGTRR